MTVSYNVDGLDIMWKDPNNTIMEFDRFGALEAGCNVSTVLVFEHLSPLNDGVFVCEAIYVIANSHNTFEGEIL